MFTRTLTRNWKVVLSVVMLALMLSVALVATVDTKSASAHTNYCIHAVTLTPVDQAPGNWYTEHKKFLFAYGTSTDVTQLFLQGKATISYSDRNYNPKGGFKNGDFGIGVQSKNQWGLSTRWTWFHQDFTSYHWLAMWDC